MSTNITVDRYQPSSPQTLGGVLPDGRARSTNTRYHYTSLDTEGLVPSYPYERRVLSRIPVPHPRLPADQDVMVLTHVSFQEVSDPRTEGIAMTECLSRQGLHEPSENAFRGEATIWPSIKFLLCWPGYEHYEWMVSVPTRTPQGQPITRQELALSIAKQYELFARLCTNSTISCTDPNWSIGSKGNTFEDMYLCSFWTMGEGVWRASVALQKDTTDEWHFAQERKEARLASARAAQGGAYGYGELEGIAEQESEPEAGSSSQAYGWPVQ